MNSNIKQNKTIAELSTRGMMLEEFKRCPIHQDELLDNLGLFVTRQLMSRIMFFDMFYQKMMDKQGCFMEFGCRYGQTLALMETFRSIYEPYNYNRKIIGFDTFEGLRDVAVLDGKTPYDGMFNVPKGYEQYLSSLLQLKRSESPISHINNIILVKGNAPEQLKKYLDLFPETLIAGMYFDFDIYNPTIDCLKILDDRIMDGCIIGFDELNHRNFPGETQAFLEYFHTKKVYKHPHNVMCSYVIA